MRYELEKIKIVPILFILFAVIARIAPHPANFAPITALALFGAVYFPRKYAFILPIGAMLFSDFIIGFYGWTMLFVYGSFLLSGLKHNILNTYLVNILYIVYKMLYKK